MRLPPLSTNVSPVLPDSLPELPPPPPSYAEYAILPPIEHPSLARVEGAARRAVSASKLRRGKASPAAVAEIVGALRLRPGMEAGHPRVVLSVLERRG